MLTYSILNAREDAPQRVLLASRAEAHAALLGVLGRAQREVRIMARDLAVFDLGSRQVVEAIERVLLANRRANVRLLADDLHWLEARAPRLKRLQRSFAHALHVREAASADPVGDEACVLVDRCASLRLEHAARALGEVWLGNEPRLQPLVATFDRCWDAAAHDLAVAPLGL